MDKTKYIGVQKEAISIAVVDSAGKLVMESTLETKAATVLEFIQGLRGTLHVTFEEGTWAAVAPRSTASVRKARHANRAE